jgi:hypothetical protein
VFWLVLCTAGKRNKRIARARKNPNTIEYLSEKRLLKKALIYYLGGMQTGPWYRAWAPPGGMAVATVTPVMMQQGMMQQGMMQQGMMQPRMMQPGKMQQGMMQQGIMQPQPVYPYNAYDSNETYRNQALALNQSLNFEHQGNLSRPPGYDKIDNTNQSVYPTSHNFSIK